MDSPGWSAARPALRARGGSLVPGALLAGVQLAEHVPQPPVHVFEDRAMLGHRAPCELVQPCQRGVNPWLTDRGPQPRRPIRIQGPRPIRIQGVTLSLVPRHRTLVPRDRSLSLVPRDRSLSLVPRHRVRILPSRVGPYLESVALLLHRPSPLAHRFRSQRYLERYRPRAPGSRTRRANPAPSRPRATARETRDGE